MSQSQKSKPQYLPKFPRLQKMFRRRQADEIVTYADSDYMVWVRPARADRRAKTIH